MILSQTPYRISFFGGGTDYPEWYRENGGAILSTTINKYCYISCRYLPPFFEHKHRLVYSQIEDVKNISEIKHRAAKAVMQYMDVTRGIEIHHDGDLPARSGIGSSSSFTVGLLNSLYALRGQRISKKDLASLAIYIEQKIIGEIVGSQDQIAASYGGLNHVEFHRDGSFLVNPVIANLDKIQKLSNNLLLFFTGFQRTAEVIAKSKVDNFDNKKFELRRMQSYVSEGLSILESTSDNIDHFGPILHESWMLKRELSSSVTTQRIDEIYVSALKAGATGGKIIGAGGGGFILFYVPEEKQAKVRETLQSLLEVHFEFETGGSRIALYDPKLAGVTSGGTVGKS